MFQALGMQYQRDLYECCTRELNRVNKVNKVNKMNTHELEIDWYSTNAIIFGGSCYTNFFSKRMNRDAPLLLLLAIK